MGRARRLLAGIGLLLAALQAVAACGRDDPAVPDGPLRIATGNTGGVYYTYGTALSEVIKARVPGLRPEVLTTDASADNIRKVAAGEAEIGFTQADVAAGSKVVALARLYDDYLHLVVRADSPVDSLAKLRNKALTVSLGALGSGTVITVRRLLEKAKIDPTVDFTAQFLGLDGSVAHMRANQVDGFFFSGGLPVRAVQELAAAMPIRLVDLSDWADDLQEFGPFYAEHTVPGSTYGVRAARTIGVPNYLVVSARLPAATAYAVTRAIFEGRAALARKHPVAERLNTREAIHTSPLPLHPGALRWYREAKR